MPFTLPWSWSADFQKQTCIVLSNLGYKVFCIMEDDAKHFLKTDTKKYEEIPGITFFRPIFFLPFQRFFIIQKINLAANYFLLNLRYFFNKKIIWIFDPQFYNFPNFFTNKISLYDCVDYHDSINKSVRNNFRKQEKKLLSNVDFVFTNSKTLQKIHTNTRKDIVVVPQGFKVEQYKINPITWNKSRKKKVIGYIGGINHRFHFYLLYKLIKSNPQWQFMFVGKIQSDEQDRFFKTKEWLGILQSLPNTSWLLAKNAKHLSELIQQFSIGIIPYDVRQPLNKYSYPMKVFEYLYHGVPIISTPIEELKQKKFKKLIYLANTAKSWQKKIVSRLDNELSKSEKEIAKKISEQNSWSKKVTKILKHLGLPTY